MDFQLPDQKWGAGSLEIDAVIAWVDGSDPAHRAKRLAALEECALGSVQNSNGLHETRFMDDGEIYYCIASILKYAPFIRRIYIVTDSQKPILIDEFYKYGICAKEKIQIVDHSVIFLGYENALPTFNSLSIETMLWRIPDLSETFMYCNDDFFLNAPITMKDIITEDGKLIIRGKVRSTWPLAIKFHLRKLRYKFTGRTHIGAHFKTAQVLAARLIGDKRYIQIGHTGHFLRKSTFQKFFSRHPEVLLAQIAPKFRSISQFLPVSLANHLEMKSNSAVIFPELESCYLKPNNYSTSILNQITCGKLQWGCIQSLDEFKSEQIGEIKSVMCNKFLEFLPLNLRGLEQKSMSAAE